MQTQETTQEAQAEQPKEEQAAPLKSETDPFAAARQFKMLYGYRFNKLVDDLSNKALRRVMKNLVNPESENAFCKTKEENEVFQIGAKLIHANLVFQLQSLGEAAEEVKQSDTANAEASNEQTNENKENTNG